MRGITAIATSVGYIVLFILAVMGFITLLTLRFSRRENLLLEPKTTDKAIVGAGLLSLLGWVLLEIGSLVTPGKGVNGVAIIAAIAGAFVLILVLISIGRLSIKK